MDSSFEWDEAKNKENAKKHGVSFEEAQLAFKDPYGITYEDITHSTKKEHRFFFLGKIGNKVCTIRFTYRTNKIRIFGAGYWRKEQKIYENENKKYN